MILNVLIIAVVGGVAYFHYAQGFFSATISAVCAICAAVLAVSYHEPLVTTLLQGKMADYANSICLIAVFALTYIILRVLLDKVVPGNLRLPLAVDRVGGGAMGVVAGIFTGGVVALAAQAMPFSPSIGGFARYDVEDREDMTIPGNVASRGRQRTASIHEQLTEDTFTAEKAHSLMLPVDEWLLGMVQKLSDNGSLAGDRTFYSIHPNYPDELFAQRLGIQVGATHTAMNLPGKTPQVTVPEPGVFRVDSDLGKTKIDAELQGLHQRPVEVKKGPSDLQLVVRVMFNKDAADTDGNVRLAPASVRLCGNGRNFYPIGTLEEGKLYANKIDDFLVINVKAEDRGADFVYLIDDPTGIVSGGAKDPNQKIDKGVFIEVKRLARVDLSGKAITVGVKPSKAKITVERKPDVVKGQPKSAGGASQEASGAPGAAVPFVFASIAANKTLFAPVNVGSGDADIKNGTLEGGTFALQSRQFSMLEIQPVRSLQVMAGKSDYAVSELFEPSGQKLVQIIGTPPPEGGDQWAFGTLRDWSVADAAGKTYAPAGVFAKVKASNSDRMAASFNIAGTPKDLSGEGTPTEVYFIFAVPTGTHLKDFKYKGASAAPLDLPVQ